MFKLQKTFVKNLYKKIYTQEDFYKTFCRKKSFQQNFY